MNFIHKYARLPQDKKLLESIELAANNLFSKLDALNVEALQISNYNERYLKSKLDNLVSNLQISSYILAWSLAKIDKPLNRSVFLDYGGGTGFLSLLAREVQPKFGNLGVGSVLSPNSLILVCMLSTAYMVSCTMRHCSFAPLLSQRKSHLHHSTRHISMLLNFISSFVTTRWLDSTRLSHGVSEYRSC